MLHSHQQNLHKKLLSWLKDYEMNSSFFYRHFDQNQSFFVLFQTKIFMNP